MSLTTTPSGSHSVTCGSLVRADRRSVAVNRSRRRAMTIRAEGQEPARVRSRQPSHRARAAVPALLSDNYD